MVGTRTSRDEEWCRAVVVRFLLSSERNVEGCFVPQARWSELPQSRIDRVCLRFNSLPNVNNPTPKSLALPHILPSPPVRPSPPNTPPLSWLPHRQTLTLYVASRSFLLPQSLIQIMPPTIRSQHRLLLRVRPHLPPKLPH